MLDVVLLGTGGMMPLPGRPLSACLLRSGGETMLFDCGEGTQVNWRVSGWPFKPCGTILLSHLHADHVAGLPGILFQLAHSGRSDPVTIYGPVHTHEIASHLAVIVGRMPFEIRVVELAGGEQLELPGEMRLESLAVQHGMPCLAYAVSLARAPRFDVERARALGVPQEHWKRLQRGETVAGVLPQDVTGPPRRGLRIALVTDTRLIDELAGFVRDADLLVCEAMYPGDGDDAERAEARGHMTARQAAGLARHAGVRRLWLTHFSPSVEDVAAIGGAARDDFPDVVVGEAGLRETLRFEDEDEDGNGPHHPTRHPESSRTDR